MVVETNVTSTWWSMHISISWRYVPENSFGELNNLPVTECPISITMQNQTTNRNRSILFSALSQRTKPSQIVVVCQYLVRGSALSTLINSSPPSAAYMRQSTGSPLFQVMACRLFGAKPLPEPMLVNWALNWGQVSVKFKLDFYHFHTRKYICKCRLQKWRLYCPEGGELSLLVTKMIILNCSDLRQITSDVKVICPPQVTKGCCLATENWQKKNYHLQRSV